MKKLLISLLSLLLAFTLTCASAESAPLMNTCGDWEYVLLPDGTAEITGYTGFAFDLTIPATLAGYSVTSIGVSAFSYSKYLLSVTIPDSVVTIRSSAFFGCTALTEVILPDSVTTIESGAFGGSAMVSITLPDSITTIERNPFTACDMLASIQVSPEHPVLSIIDGALFDKTTMSLICYPPAFPAESYTVPQGTLAILDYAFYRCFSLTNISIPASVVSIGQHAFDICLSLRSLTVEPGSYAEQYCKTLHIPHTFPAGN